MDKRRVGQIKERFEDVYKRQRTYIGRGIVRVRLCRCSSGHYY